MKKSSVLIRRAALLTAIAVCAAVAAGLFAYGIFSRIRADGAARETLLPQAPYVSNLDNGLIYHDQLVRAAFPYGLAWQYHQEAGNLGLAAQYRNMFIEAVNRNYCFLVRKHR